jgi:hypothetical protein
MGFVVDMELWDRFFFEFFGFALPISLHHGSSYSYIIWGMNNRPFSCGSSETSSHSIDINKNFVVAIMEFDTI